MIRAPALALALALVVAWSACSGPAEPGAGPYLQLVVFRTDHGPVRLRVALATGERERAHGLMGVTDLPADAGMAFLWSRPTESSFWMKNTQIPLSIAFVERSGAIVAIREMSPCAADPCPVYGSPQPYVMAVEANAGWFSQHRIEVGDIARSVIST